MKPKTLELTKPSDREVCMRRSFDAPAGLVFDALTKPELVRRWLLGPPGWHMPVCEIDLRVGGAFRYVWSHPEHDDFGLTGTYQEIVAPERIVHTESFEPDNMGGESLVTVVLTEERGSTTVSMTVRYESEEVRDSVIARGMASGVEASYDRLDELLGNL